MSQRPVYQELNPSEEAIAGSDSFHESNNTSVVADKKRIDSFDSVKVLLIISNVNASV
jgi:hypothetical protein